MVRNAPRAPWGQEGAGWGGRERSRVRYSSWALLRGTGRGGEAAHATLDPGGGATARLSSILSGMVKVGRWDQTPGEV